MQPEGHDDSLLWRVASNASGEAVTHRLTIRRRSTVASPPQSSRLTLRKRRETSIATLQFKVSQVNLGE